MVEKTDFYLNYYKDVLSLDEDDFIQFKVAVLKPLAYTFRIVRNAHFTRITEFIKKNFFQICQPIECVKDTYIFYKHNQISNCSYDMDLYNQFTEFLISNTAVGNIQRQEIVSMIPVELLSIQKNHFVYEPCAAPGSKTKQILEKLNGTGLLVANDVSKSRVNILITESQKNNTLNLVITNDNAGSFPQSPMNKNFFDRICCDVPCSGDGTVRKNISIFNDWSVKRACQLIDLQIKILQRSLSTLKEGGILTYSTCSLNPLENEYVINRALLNFPNCKIILPQEAFNLVSYTKDKTKLMIRKGIPFFQYTIDSKRYEYNDCELEKCIRIYPHDNDTGGFFIAIIQKQPMETEEKRPIWAGIAKMHKSVENYVPRTEIDDRFITNNSLLHYIFMKPSHKKIFVVNNNVYKYLMSNPDMHLIMTGIKGYEKTTTIGGNNNLMYMPNNKFLNTIDFSENIICIDIDNLLKFSQEEVIEKKKISNLDIQSIAGYHIVSVKDLNYKFMIYCNNNKIISFMKKTFRQIIIQLYSK